jgi:hypothetical protein
LIVEVEMLLEMASHSRENNEGDFGLIALTSRNQSSKMRMLTVLTEEKRSQWYDWSKVKGENSKKEQWCQSN